MAKRSAVRRIRADYVARDGRNSGGVHLNVIDGGWDPVADDQNYVPRKKKRTAAANDHHQQQQQHREPPREQAYVKNIQPKSEGQARLMEAIDTSNLVLALGPAGTGKTYIAIAKAVDALRAGKIGRIVLCRPAVDAGENIGFLPGDMEEKLAPYLRPLYDALQDRMSAKQVKAMIAEGQIEIASVGFMRGRTLNNAFIVVDEAQNCTYVQLKMILTRLGWNSKMIVTGDPAQSDLLPEMSGLAPVADRIESMKGDIGVVRLQQADVVRHPLVARMLDVL
ncbi:MAG: PhoH family protein [Alphaproteobacteria bacterium]|jgi:phosphate starvation-inducible protein PhoH and related proteins|nr:MAG: PhoH family protein [Alphaproteobacteria bacterium]